MILSLGAAFFSGCSRKDEAEPVQNPSGQEAGNKDSQALTVRNEEQWIVEAITKELAALASFASDQASLPAEALAVKRLEVAPPRYEIEINLREPIRGEIVLESAAGSIWNPARYTPLATTLLKAAGDPQKLPEAPSAEAEHTALITALSSPTAEQIQKENRRLSARLTSHPLDPDAYEQAALLLGVMGMRENSGMFWETRGLCNRATAALAFAQSLREMRSGGGKTSESAQLAKLLIGLLADTKKESEEAIRDLGERAKANPALAPWATAAALRNSRDWRVLERPDEASLLERLEYFRAVGEAVSPETARERLTAYEPDTMPDWARIPLQFSFSVGTGHEVTGDAMTRELKEIGDIFPEVLGEDSSPARLSATLNRPPGGFVEPNLEGKAEIQVIDDGTWALYFQRHLCHIAQRTHVFLSEKWGVHDKAAQFRAGIAKLCGGLTFFPLLQQTGMGAAPDAASQTAATELLSRHPEWIPDAAWGEFARNGGPAAALAQSWFSNGLPIGTAYSFYSRVKTVPRVVQMSLAEAEALYAIAPWHYGVARQYLFVKTRGTPTAGQFHEVMGRFLDFNIAAMLAYSKLVEDDPVLFGNTLAKAAQLDPYYYLRLADYYVKRNMKPEAATAFKAAIKNKANAVAIANRSDWLINYYYEQGKTDDALALARMAAEVYSFKGLKAMADLSEKMGNLSIAEEHFQKIHERYDDVSPLFLFYQRQVAKDPASPLASRMESLLGSTFPEGLKDAALKDFSGPPTSGVLINGKSTLLSKNGLKKGDIITALDGKRVDDFPQYAFVRSLKETPEMELIVYQDGVYRAIKASAPERRFKCSFDTYTPGN